MTIYFVDSSALVKRYISEIGSGWVLNLFDRTVRSASWCPQAKSGHQDALRTYPIVVNRRDTIGGFGI